MLLVAAAASTPVEWDIEIIATVVAVGYYLHPLQRRQRRFQNAGRDKIRARGMTLLPADGPSQKPPALRMLIPTGCPMTRETEIPPLLRQVTKVLIQRLIAVVIKR